MGMKILIPKNEIEYVELDNKLNSVHVGNTLRQHIFHVVNGAWWIEEASGRIVGK